MPIFYLVLTIIFGSIYTIFTPTFSRLNKEGKNFEIIFNLFLTFGAMFCWFIVYLTNITFEPLVLLYSLGFGICFFGVFYFFQKAILTGPFSLSSLFMNMALIVSTIWGFIFWGSKVNGFSISGIVLVSTAIAFLVLKKNEGDKKSNLKWIIYSLLTLVCNAGCAIFQKEEQIKFNNQHGYQLMFFALLFSFIFSLFFYFIKRKNIALINKKSLVIPFLGGALNFGLNFFVILLASTDLSPNIIYPTLAVSVLVINILFSFIFLKEKLSIIQIIGIVLGIIGIVLLSQ